MSTQAIPFILLQGFLFGSTLVASRFCVGQFEPTTYIGLRLLIASTGHLLVYLVGRRRYTFPTSPTLWRHAAILGILGTSISSTFVVMSLQYQSAGVTSVFITMSPVFTVLMAHFFLSDQKLKLRTSLGVFVAFGGALLLVIRGESGILDGTAANPLGYALVLIGLLGTASSNVYAHKYMRDLNGFDVASVRMFVAMLSVLPLSVLLVGFDLSRVDTTGYLALFYAGIVGNFAGFLLAFYIVKKFGATASGMPGYVIPVVASLGGALLLDEKITAGMLAGMVLIIIGITIINQKPPIEDLKGTSGIDPGCI
ncbi:MAG: DMT family transporter [Anaerolineales bacterium]|nr:DMT family transporter [Anaerolineales bacterium]